MSGLMDKYEVLKLKNQMCFPLYAASREVVKHYYPYLSALDITYTQYIAMMVLWETPKISTKELGSRLYLDSGTLTPLLKSLEKKGFVTRARDKQDERNLIVELTDEGLKLRDKALDIPAQVASCFHLDENEAIVLYRALYKILDETNK